MEVAVCVEFVLEHKKWKKGYLMIQMKENIGIQG